MRTFVVVAAIGLLASCAGAARPDRQAEQQALMQTSREWAKAAASGDAERTVPYWADDAVVLAPDQPAMVGKAAIRDFINQTRTIPQFSITWEPEQATVAASGDFGYLVEHNRVTFADSTGALHTQYGKAVTVWRKDASGAWKCVIDTWNNNPTERVLAR